MPWRHSSKPNGVYKRTSPCMKATLSRHRKPFTLSFWHKRTGVSNMMWTSTSLEGGREGAVQVCDVRRPGGLTLGSLSHLTLPVHCLSYSLHYCGLLETTSLKLGNQLSSQTKVRVASFRHRKSLCLCERYYLITGIITVFCVTYHTVLRKTCRSV